MLNGEKFKDEIIEEYQNLLKKNCYRWRWQQNE